MKRIALLTVLAALVPAVAFGQAEKADSGSLSDKAAKDQPGTSAGGPTATPNAKPEDGKGSLSDKAAKDQPGVTGGGSTAAPTAEPNSGSLSDKAKDTPDVK